MDHAAPRPPHRQGSRETAGSPTLLHGELLQDWIREAERDAPAPVRSFAGFLRQDLAAVTAGLTLPWSSGIVEGNVNRVKTIKRSVYGRASFRLLRIRILTRS